MAVQVLFANGRTSDKETAPDGSVVVKRKNPKPRWWEVLLEQVINSAIVAGIATLSAAWVDPWVGLKAFALTFLVEMRKYRKL